MKFGFRNKIVLGLFLLLLIQGFVLFFWISNVMKTALNEELKSRGRLIGQSLATRVVEPMLTMDLLQMKILVDETVSLDDDIFYTFIQDTGGNPVTHTFKNGFPVALKTINPVADNQEGSLQLLDTGKQVVYDYAVPVYVENNRLGTIRLGLFRTRAERAGKKVIISTIITLLLTLISAGIVGTLLLRPVLYGIRKLHESSEQALRGNLDVKAAPMLGENCWDIMQCGQETCLAYKNYHHRCWYLAGTLCPTCVEGEYAKKIDSCRQCRVYKKCSGDEIQSLAESFDAMTLSLKGNLSDLKTAEGILNEQKALLQTILDAIPDFISLQDHEGRYISVNRAFCEMLNKTKEEIVRKTNDELFSKIHAAYYNQEDRNILETRIPLVKENRVLGPKGLKWLHVVKIPVLEAENKVRGLVCSGRDITQLKAVQDQLTHAQKMESVGRLAAGVAHEINTPLGIILGYAQLLLEDVEQDGQIHKDVANIVKQTKICSKIVADLLKFSRSSTSITSEFDINDAIREVLGMVEHTFSLNHVMVNHELNDKSLMMKGDKEKLKQVFINLLNNAFDAVKENGSIFVKTKLDKLKDVIKISISDTGCGITKDNIRKIFEPFYTTKGPDKGTGLGLSVTFGIIKEHNGTIKVYSPPISGTVSGKKGDKGTQFIVVLPTGLKTKKGESNGQYSGIG